MPSLDAYWKTVVHGGGGLLGHCVRGLLWTLSLPYGVVSDLRNLAYDRGWFTQRRVNGPLVISIGNIVVGGTGKTPVVVKVAQALENAGCLAILTRGYRSSAETSRIPLHIAPGTSCQASVCGDEPCLLSQRLPHAHLFVGRNRWQSAQMAVEAGATILLLDDGMQHRQLARDFEIAVVDADQVLGGGYLFPRGPLRERSTGLKRAHLIVVNHVQSQEQFQSACHCLGKLTDAPIVGMRPVVSSIKPQVPLSGLKVGLFCGIAHPERFVETAKQLGVEIVSTLFSDDHRLPTPSRLAEFAQRCQEQGAQWLLCTEKDSVKLAKYGPMALPLAVVYIDLEIVYGESNWSKLQESISLPRKDQENR